MNSDSSEIDPNDGSRITTKSTKSDRTCNVIQIGLNFAKISRKHTTGFVVVIAHQECFQKALSVVEKELLIVIKYYAEVWYPAVPKVFQAVNERFSVDPSGAIVSFEENYSITPYLDEVDEYCRQSSNQSQDDQNKQASRPLFSLSQRHDKTWSVTALSETGYRFKQRLPLPEEWRGLRDQELSDKVGIPGCVFVHASGFLGVHNTRDGALQMAKLAIKSAGLCS